MDERRIERALRQGPLDEPTYMPAMAKRIAAEDRLKDEATDAAVFGPVHRRGVSARWERTTGRLPLTGAAAAALAIVLVVVTVLSYRSIVGPGASPTPEPRDMLDRLYAAGSVRIVVSNEPPQAVAAGGAYIGFDFEVAEALAGELRLRPEVVALPRDQIFGGEAAWHLAFPSRALAPETPGVRESSPYYAWPAWLVVGSGSAIADVDQLAGQVVCVVDDSAGSDWLDEARPPGIDVTVEPPADAQRVERPSDDECLAAVARGEAAAAVTAALLDDELTSRGVDPLGGSPVLVENRAVVVRGSADDTATLLQAIETALGELRSSGRLSELSREAFGGRDLTATGR